MKQQPQPFPLCWPDGRPRAKARKDGSFQRTAADAVNEIRRQINLMRAGGLTISTNMAAFNQAAPSDPGVACWFTYKSQERVIAVDTYRSVKHNLCAIANSLVALRTIERHGGIDVFEQALKGFDVAALPAPRRPWHEVLRVYPDAPLPVIEAAYRAEAQVTHPDKPTGSTEAFQALQEAYEEAKKERQ